MILFLIVCIFGGIFLAAAAAPIIVASNRQKLNEMDAVIERYHQLPITRQHSLAVKQHYAAELIAIKNAIWSGDKQALEAARDKLSLI